MTKQALNCLEAKHCDRIRELEAELVRLKEDLVIIRDFKRHKS